MINPEGQVIMALSFRLLDEELYTEKTSSEEFSSERIEEDMVFSGLMGMRI